MKWSHLEQEVQGGRLQGRVLVKAEVAEDGHDAVALYIAAGKIAAGKLGGDERALERARPGRVLVRLLEVLERRVGGVVLDGGHQLVVQAPPLVLALLPPVASSAFEKPGLAAVGFVSGQSASASSSATAPSSFSSSQLATTVTPQTT